MAEPETSTANGGEIPGPASANGIQQQRSYAPKWQAARKNAQKKFITTVDKITNIGKKDRPTQGDLLDPSELPVVTVGPVVGKVTETSARVLIEISKPGRVVVLVLTEGEGINKSAAPGVEKTLEAGRPAVFAFENLAPGTQYRVKVTGCNSRQSSGFRTFPAEISDSATLNFGVISCNKIFITDKEIPSSSDLWAHLAKAVEQGKIDMCLHVGDQIYGDGDKMLDAEAGEHPDDWSDCFKKSKALLSNLGKDQWNPHYETICESYRQVYRKTWSHPHTAYCLANCPNLMIYDDHEVRDNWADLPNDWDRSSVDFFVALCAWRVNVEYQRQLHEDIRFDKLGLIDEDYHFHLINGVGMMFLDIRGSRTFHRVEDDRYKYLGSKQWQDIQAALKGGMFESARVLLVCTPAPLVFLQSNFTDVLAKNVPRLEDFKGHWSAAPYIEEQKLMIECLTQWKNGSNGRDVLVLGGDVHCGGHSEILKNGDMVFRQMTSSAIANHPLPKPAYYFLRAAETLSGVGQNVTFRHHDWTRARNYGLVRVRNHGPTATARAEVSAQLIKAKFMVGVKDGKKVSSLETSSTDCCGGCISWES